MLLALTTPTVAKAVTGAKNAYNVSNATTSHWAASDSPAAEALLKATAGAEISQADIAGTGTPAPSCGYRV
jgi:hypothetical protein